MGGEEGAEDGHEGEEEEEEAADDALAVGPGFAPEGSVGVAGEDVALLHKFHQSLQGRFNTFLTRRGIKNTFYPRRDAKGLREEHLFFGGRSGCSRSFEAATKNTFFFCGFR